MLCCLEFGDRWIKRWFVEFGRKCNVGCDLGWFSFDSMSLFILTICTVCLQLWQKPNQQIKKTLQSISSYFTAIISHSKQIQMLCMTLIKCDCPRAVVTETIHGYSEFESAVYVFLRAAPNGMFPLTWLWLLHFPAADCNELIFWGPDAQEFWRVCEQSTTTYC